MLIKLPGHKEGDDLTIMNTMVKRGRDENNKYCEWLTITYRDNVTGIKHVAEIKNPLYEFYTVKPEYRARYNRQYIERDKCDIHTAPRIRLEKEICSALGLKAWYDQKLREGDRKAIKNIHRHPDVFMSDTNLEDAYRFWFANTYQNSIGKISKCFFDIEVDGVDLPSGAFPYPGECPVNAISVIFQEQKQCYQLLLRTKKNPLIAEYEQYMSHGGVADMKQFILNHVSEHNKNPDGTPFCFGLEDFNFNVLFYNEEDEIHLIGDLFTLINQYKPDFALAWNQAFDVPYMIARIKELGYNPEDIICHKDFTIKNCWYFVDEKNKDMFDERTDHFDCSSYTVYLDQMIQFASRRKGQTKFPSYSLDAIGEIMANVRKLDYKNITADIAQLPYKDYKTFSFYNMMDTIVQYCIEFYTQDIDYVFSKCLMNHTRYSKIHRQTVYLTNRGLSYMWDYGYVKGNNVNLDNSKRPYPGAFVADPLNVSDFARLLINGRPSDIFDNTVDSDYKSLYPSIIRQFNCFAYTQIGFIMIADSPHTKMNRTHYEHYTAGGQFLEDLQSHNWLEFASRWMGLPDFSELYKYTKDLFTKEIRPSHPIRGIKPVKDGNGCYEPFTVYSPYYFPFVEVKNSDGYYRPFAIRKPMSSELKSKMEGWVENVKVRPNQSF